MPFIKIWVLNEKSSQGMGEELVPVLFNESNIVSIKPIRIVKEEKIIEGYWIRTTGNKKYRAASIPKELSELFEDDDIQAQMISSSSSHGPSQELLN